MTTADTPVRTDDLRADYYRYGFDALSDAELVGRVARTLSVPRDEPADSFVLHAPLELTARASLLPFVHPRHREATRLRLFALADSYEISGPPVAAPEAAAFDSLEDAADRLLVAIDRADLDAVDPAAAWLGRAASPEQLRALLADAILSRLAAAAHAPIFLWHLPRVAPRHEITGELLRGLARELARNPEWRLHWIDERVAADPAPSIAVFDALAAVPRADHDGPTPFIFPLMSAVDEDGTAAELLAPVTRGRDVAGRGRAVLRAAAWSMLLEPGDHAPYGWSHCLTMPQAALGIAGACADPSRALAVAGSYVVGFRARIAREPLTPFAPADPAVAWRDALAGEPAVAAAAVWHAAADGGDGPIVSELATRASIQRDAHLVKYTLACLDAAADDPAARRLFLAAAASLVAWWSRVTDPEDPLAG